MSDQMLKNTLYAHYIREREKLEILEDDNGFITYKFLGDECFISNMCVEPSQRRKGGGSFLIERLADISRVAGCKYLAATIHLGDPGASNTLIAALLVGFIVLRAEYGTLTITKEIGG